MSRQTSTGNYLHTPANAVYNNMSAFTIQAWINVAAFPSTGNYSTLVVKDPTNTYSIFLQIGGNPDNDEKAVVAGYNGGSVESNIDLALSTWTHVLMTFENSGSKEPDIYINGTKVSKDQIAASTTPNDSGDGFYFGDDTLGGDGFSGDIAEVAIWNTVLSAGEITSAAASTTGVASIASANLVGYWHLCGTASPEPDATANGDNATIVGTPSQGPDSPGFSCSAGPASNSVNHNVDCYIGAGPASPFVVASAQVSGNPNGGSVTFPSVSVAKGDLVIAWVRWNNLGTGTGQVFNPTLSDNQSNNYVPISGSPNTGIPTKGPTDGISGFTRMYGAATVAQATESITVSISQAAGLTQVDGMLLVVRNANTAKMLIDGATTLQNIATVIQQVANGEGNGQLANSGTLTSQSGNTLALACGGTSNPGPMTIGAPTWTTLQTLPQMTLADPFLGPTEQINAEFMQGGFYNWLSQMVLIDPVFSPGHYVDAYVLLQQISFVQIAGSIIFPIISPPVNLAATILQPQLSAVNLAATIVTPATSFLNLEGTIVAQPLQYLRIIGTILNNTDHIHSVDCDVAVSSLSFVQMIGTILQNLNVGPCGSYPDSSFVNLRGWIVAPGDSQQMPGSGFTPNEDFLSSQTALAVYKPISVFILNGIALIVTAFTTGVVSWQTRTRSWLRRVDAAPNGILLTTTVNTHTLPNGAVITTTTNVVQNQDVLTTTVTIQNSATPERTSVIITNKSKSGQISTIEKDTVNLNGVATTTTKQVFTTPPTTENIQPLKVVTLDGVTHYQFFDQANSEWAGGDQEGITTSTSEETIVGNTKTTNETVDTPDGKHIETTTTVTGTQDAGTTTTQTTENYEGTQTTVHKVVTYPNGAQTITDTVTDDTTGDSVETDVETVTDEYGQVTVTTTKTETTTVVNPTTGVGNTTITKTVTVDKGGVTTVDNQVQTTTDFEDDIYTQKVQVIFIQEFTLSVVIDEAAMFGLWEINQTHQKNYALLELFGQQLGNLNLSYKLRQSLIDQFNVANACVIPVTFQANGRTYSVVFAPSASAFRAKYIPGTEPHVYELQLILQERSNLINGTNTSF